MSVTALRAVRRLRMPMMKVYVVCRSGRRLPRAVGIIGESKHRPLAPLAQRNYEVDFVEHRACLSAKAGAEAPTIGTLPGDVLPTAGPPVYFTLIADRNRPYFWEPTMKTRAAYVHSP